MNKCKRCGRELRSEKSIKRSYGKTCYRIVQLQEANKPEQFDMKKIKTFITLEIQRVFKEFNFNSPVIHNNSEDIGVVPIRIIKMPKLNPFEINKRLVVKELKEQLQKGINNMLQEIGSFDNQINFLEAPVGILA